MERNNNKNIQETLDKIYPQEKIEELFCYIENDILRKNIAIVYKYILFLIHIIEEHKIKGIIRSAMYKDMIIYIGTIVESCLHYCLQKNIKTKKIKEEEIFDSSWEEDKTSSKDIYKINDNQKIVGVLKNKITKKLTEKTEFIFINRACKRINILSPKLFEKAEKIREERNKIHIKSLLSVEDSYTRSDVDKFFYYTEEILKKVKEKC